MCGDRRNAEARGCLFGGMEGDAGAGGMGELGKQSGQGLPARSQVLERAGKEVITPKSCWVSLWHFCSSPSCSHEDPCPWQGVQDLCSGLHQPLPRNYLHWVYFLLGFYDPTETINTSEA